MKDTLTGALDTHVNTLCKQIHGPRYRVPDLLHAFFPSGGKSIQIMMYLDFGELGFELHLTSISVGILALFCNRENEKTASMFQFPAVWSPGFNQSLMTLTKFSAEDY